MIKYYFIFIVTEESGGRFIVATFISSATFYSPHRGGKWMQHMKFTYVVAIELLLDPAAQAILNMW